MQNVFNSIKGTALEVASALTPVLKESRFREQGRITPEEFVAAGEHLAHHCPTWSWATGDESKLKSYLPKDKQFLVTRNVPCLRRCKQMEFTGVEKIVEENEDDEGWVTHEGDTGYDGVNETSEMVHEMTLDSNKLDEIRDEKASGDVEDEDEEAVDMEDFEESGMLEKVDPSVAIIPATLIKPITNTLESETDSVLHTRTYDLHITYNKYYQTPHLFLIGYDEHRKPLSVEEMFEDVSQDNAKKTVTIENHPHLGPNMASIHPCKHGDLMKKFIQIAEDGGNELSVHSYLIIFLKFVQSVIPTVNYDYSQNFTL